MLDGIVPFSAPCGEVTLLQCKVLCPFLAVEVGTRFGGAAVLNGRASVGAAVQNGRVFVGAAIEEE